MWRFTAINDETEDGTIAEGSVAGRPVLDNKDENNGHPSVLQLGKNRLRLPWWGYVLLFVLVDVLGIAMLQWGVALSSSRASLSSPLIGFWGFVEQMWTLGRFVFVLNLLILGLIYAFVLLATNRFWLSSGTVLVVCTVIGVVERFKVMARYEAILPSDVRLAGSNAGELTTFLPNGSQWLICGAVVVAVVIIALCALASHFDATGGRVIRGNMNIGKVAGRLGGCLVSMALVVAFSVSVGTVDTWANTVAHTMGDMPSMWDSVYDSQRNGALLAFARQLDPRVMTEPQGYSEAGMDALVKRYQSEAKTINAKRDARLTDSSVIFVLSESFSDPTRVPGVKLNHDPMPKIRAVKESTTSGLMLSSGYGGGTANLEYQALTGLSMANFDPSLTSPYQQLVPGLTWAPTVNQSWDGGERSVAFHPYQSSMYSRAADYKKFGFPHFYTLNEPDVISPQVKKDNSPYIDDESAYTSVLDWMKRHKDSRFVQLATMQNHMPYHNWYADNAFSATAAPGAERLGDDETVSINTYSKGVNITDEATATFLEKLDKLDRPVTVVWYGDHLPGIYSTAGSDSANSLALHESDYFIWSNKRAASHGTKLSNATYTSPNFFMAQAAEHMDAKVSPYLAFLTLLHERIAAIEPPVVNKIQGWNRIPEGQPIYLNAKGEPMSADDFDAKTKELMHDYRLIQYDITAGRHYLENTGFMTVPGGSPINLDISRKSPTSATGSAVSMARSVVVGRTRGCAPAGLHVDVATR
ncbi:Phosphoglycerol transferase MdoB [Bifidobacterium bohemicum]|uniref:Sulfatase n=1 Tax=Bifidobacterium bohemicum DSM 22767 TaxID=1437606 RepID=A0A086ZFY5_9BIFI|nr:sulfatase [Bifidobacterium bohemicum DSM 22767]SCB72994.1 Phosphoglycerol transferase MdoB [Bifidobacterium bohemicum]